MKVFIELILLIYNGFIMFDLFFEMIRMFLYRFCFVNCYGVKLDLVGFLYNDFILFWFFIDLLFLGM